MFVRFLSPALVVTLTFYVCNHVCLIIKYYDIRILCVRTQQTNATAHTYTTKYDNVYTAIQ